MLRIAKMYIRVTSALSPAKLTRIHIQTLCATLKSLISHKTAARSWRHEVVFILSNAVRDYRLYLREQ